MKKLFYLLILSTVVLFHSCKEEDELKIVSVDVQLVYPSGVETASEVTVKLTSSAGSSFEATTSADGLASFKLPFDVYEATVSEKRSAAGYVYIYNGVLPGINVSSSWSSETPVNLELTQSESGQIVIKELYNGGCQKDDLSGSYSYDSYVIVYNNSELSATLDDLCLGMTLPYSSSGTNKDLVDGEPFYFAEEWTPAGQAFWYFQNAITLEPGEEMVIALKGAIDHTQTYANSVNLANSEYYCTYDLDHYTREDYYPSPSAEIAPSKYLKAYVYGAGNAWSLSTNSPAFFIFRTKDSSPQTFGESADNLDNYGGSSYLVRKKVPNNWVMDGVEVYRADKEVTEQNKRFSSDIDAGYVSLTNKLGYTLYRNVDKDATEALAENEGLLIYNYAYGTEIDGVSSTDPSGIDAEASIANGARIIYMDTNNSSNDFHQRSQSSLKD